jgi:hypothetical protein
MDRDEEDLEAQEMAAAMGFSSFGSHKPAAKKRRFNPTTDAYVEGQELASLDKGGKKGQGSGGNTVPLGKTRIIGSGPGAADSSTGQKHVPGGNQDEIDLGEDQEELGDGPNYIDTSLPPPIEQGRSGGLPYADVSQPPPASDEEAREVQRRIDVLLASLENRGSENTSVAESSSGTQPLSHDLPARPGFRDGALMQGGPRPSYMSRNDFNDTASVASSSRPSERGQKNANWYVGYYDPSFNENPWTRLEQAKGLEPLGKWPDNQGVRMFP